MDNLRAFVYFVELDIIQSMLNDWPQDIRIALCLQETGQCEVIFFHKNEAKLMIARVCRLLKVEKENLGVIPETKGHPVKIIRFSDQQRLLKLLVEKDDICERASDYAINYRFAEEEGLDPNYFTRLSGAGKKSPTITKPKDSALVKPFISRRSKTVVDIKSSNKSDKNTPPKDRTLFSGHFAEIARIEQVQGEIHLTLNPDTAATDLVPYKAMDIGYLNEPNQFLIERPLLRQWEAGQSAVIKISPKLFLNKFAHQYFQTPRIAVVMIVPNGVFITCGSQIQTLDAVHRPINFPYYKAVQKKLAHANDKRLSK